MYALSNQTPLNDSAILSIADSGVCGDENYFPIPSIANNVGGEISSATISVVDAVGFCGEENPSAILSVADSGNNLIKETSSAAISVGDTFEVDGAEPPAALCQATSDVDFGARLTENRASRMAGVI